MKKNPLPAREDLLQRFVFDLDSGTIKYRRTSHGGKSGDLAGTKRTDGYIRVKFQKRFYFAHRLIYFIETGEQPDYIDHINGDRSNNRISNLRAATNSENMCNHQRRRPAGVFFKSGRWHGRVMKNYVTHRIKPSIDKAVADERLRDLRQSLHGEFACI
jgi:hypothetical protein